ncbi:peroxidase family protein [Pararhizobium haloflavum]|uniref:peroxidase family protein n=1 Tax=Pararhizobium haloflavum TaxID=2037914 RepID=UPI000C1996AF|nr:heme peroxidase family protein [Pararhizobium haloflavum]
MSLKTKSKPKAKPADPSTGALPPELMNALAAGQSAIKLTPGHGTAGRHPTRQLLDALSGHKDPGMFGRMFPKLPPLEVPDTKLEKLADAMLDGDPTDTTMDNPNIPAGFTYLGQFVDHDITLDLTSLADKVKDPLGVENFRTPSLDLDALYGLGPDGSPHLYERNPADLSKHGPKFLIGKNMTVGFGGVTGDFFNDLPRSPQGMALIGDHRNDENLLVAQTHLAFLKFHNKVCDMLSSGANPPENIFAEARRTVTWHYQWLVLHDWVERLTEPGIVARILHDGRKYYRFKKTPYMPVEFSAAAYRLGHSMVRQRYSHNRVFQDIGFDLLFGFSGLSGQIIGDLAPNPPTGPLPVSVLPSNWIIDWRRFYDLGTPAATGFTFNRTRRIDPFLVEELHNLPGNGGNLAFRNLKRGVNLGLPSGQEVARHMKVKNPLTADEIASGPDGQVARQQGLDKATPLWYYILKEASVRHNGERLGPVGSTIVAEVFVGLVHGDTQSYLWQVKNWKPTLPAQTAGTFTMADMLRFIDDVNPIGT